jgi:hypothetical protein
MGGASSGACAARDRFRRAPCNTVRSSGAARHVACETATGHKANPARQGPMERVGKIMAQIVIPNLFHLTGSHLHVTYSTSSIAGTPIMTYQDPQQGMSFEGDEIRTVECDLGTLVSVTLRMTVDTGSTSLSVFIPRMRIEQGTVASVHTDCVTTVHRFSIIPAFSLGQLDTYSIVPLHGTAQFVLF